MTTSKLDVRDAPLELSGDEFRALGHTLVDRIADFLDGLPTRRVTPGDTPRSLRALLGVRTLPREGSDPARLLDEAAELLFEHSTFNGHPRFWGYITSSAAPIGALADLLAGAVNPNVGSWGLAPIATEIELECIRWIAELIGYPREAGGVLVSGGNMANMVCFLAARRAKLGPELRTAGLAAAPRAAVYASAETHTWIQKAVDLFGFGTDAIRWIPVDDGLRMDVDALRARIGADREDGARPFLVVGTAGTVSTGAVDPLAAIARLCREEELWFHVDGAYGALAACLPDASDDLRALALADSVAVDPHKWLYAPLEAGCALVRDPQALTDAFAWHPAYYHFEESDGAPVNFYERGPQNSRGFRALKVWLALRQAGRAGYERMIADDCALARELAARAAEHPELEVVTQGLSITTFRYAPRELRGQDSAREYLDTLNDELLTRLKESGEAYVSNAVVGGRFVLRACVVNFRTTEADIAALPDIVVRLGRDLDRRSPG